MDRELLLHHRNVMVDPDDRLRRITQQHPDARCRVNFGAMQLWGKDKFPAVKELGDDGTVLLELFQRLLGKRHIDTQHSGRRSQKLFHRQTGMPIPDVVL